MNEQAQRTALRFWQVLDVNGLEIGRTHARSAEAAVEIINEFVDESPDSYPLGQWPIHAVELAA